MALLSHATGATRQTGYGEHVQSNNKTAKIRRHLGFEPKVPLERGIDHLIPWMREQSAEDRFLLAGAELEARGAD